MLQDPQALVVPDGTGAIEERQYSGADHARVFVPKSVTEIRKNAFDGCANLKEVVFEEGSKLRVIGREAFNNCTNLRGIDLPDSVVEIGLDAFYGSGLETFVAPRALRTIRQSAFQDCKSLKRVQLNEGLEVLGTDDHPDGKDWCGVFQGSAVEHVELPATLKKIEYSAFEDCRSLKNIALPEGLEFIGRAAFLETGLEEVEFPASLRVVT